MNLTNVVDEQIVRYGEITQYIQLSEDEQERQDTLEVWKELTIHSLDVKLIRKLAVYMQHTIDCGMPEKSCLAEEIEQIKNCSCDTIKVTFRYLHVQN